MIRNPANPANQCSDCRAEAALARRRVFIVKGTTTDSADRQRILREAAERDHDRPTCARCGLRAVAD